MDLRRFDIHRALLRDAVRKAAQAAVAAVATYLALRAVGLAGEAFVGILAAVLILQPSIGGTLEAAKTRIVATVVGVVVGTACLLALPSGWGTAAALAVTMVLLNLMAKLRPDWSYGVVCAVSLSLTVGDDLTVAAWHRTTAIAIGAAIGMVASAVVWPESARRRYERHLASALRGLSRALCDVFEKGRRPDEEPGVPHAGEVRDGLRRANDAIDALHLADHATRRARADAVQESWNALWIFDRVLTDAPAIGDDIVTGPLAAFRDACRGLRQPVAS